jgi:hypothetical protein
VGLLVWFAETTQAIKLDVEAEISDNELVLELLQFGEFHHKTHNQTASSNARLIISRNLQTFRRSVHRQSIRNNTFPTLSIYLHSSRTNMNPWRHSMARDLHSDFDSMFSRSGATLPRGEYGSFFN